MEGCELLMAVSFRNLRSKWHILERRYLVQTVQTIIFVIYVELWGCCRTWYVFPGNCQEYQESTPGLWRKTSTPISILPQTNIAPENRPCQNLMKICRPHHHHHDHHPASKPGGIKGPVLMAPIESRNLVCLGGVLQDTTLKKKSGTIGTWTWRCGKGHAVWKIRILRFHVAFR